MNALQPSPEFSETLIEKDVFEREILMLLGRDLHLSQSVALEQCRKYVDIIVAMWMDGFSIEYTFKHIRTLLVEAAKTDEELKWQINPAVLQEPNKDFVALATVSNDIPQNESDEEMYGTVKWYSAKKGFGFISCDEIDEDIFVHHKEIVGDGFKKLASGQDVLFELAETDRGYEALKVQKQ